MELRDIKTGNYGDDELILQRKGDDSKFYYANRFRDIVYIIDYNTKEIERKNIDEIRGNDFVISALSRVKASGYIVTKKVNSIEKDILLAHADKLSNTLRLLKRTDSHIELISKNNDYFINIFTIPELLKENSIRKSRHMYVLPYIKSIPSEYVYITVSGLLNTTEDDSYFRKILKDFLHDINLDTYYMPCRIERDIRI